MGHPEIRLLYLTPETLFSKKYKDALVKAYRQKQIKRLVVDEVRSRSHGHELQADDSPRPISSMSIKALDQLPS